ncbi:MAG TPA: Minf_1886 family protein [Phycisphaerales bacterium]|nr:Minf_1886 family protein [Phycisphaerales bacterium]
MSVSHPSYPSPAPAHPDWAAIRVKARSFSPAAFDFIRDGLAHTVQTLAKTVEVPQVPESEAVIAQPPTGRIVSRHITGQQLCDGLRDMARERYGMLALTVLHRWGLRATADFGVIVYALIDRGEMRCSDEDRFDDFLERYDFEEAFSAGA